MCLCQTTKKHSTYTQHLQDLPSTGLVITLHLKTAKWNCKNAKCSQLIFAERFSWLTPYARKTIRATILLKHLAFAASCLVAEKLAKVAGFSVSHDTLLRIIYQTNVTPRTISNVIRID